MFRFVCSVVFYLILGAASARAGQIPSEIIENFLKNPVVSLDAHFHFTEHVFNPFGGGRPVQSFEDLQNTLNTTFRPEHILLISDGYLPNNPRLLRGLPQEQWAHDENLFVQKVVARDSQHLTGVCGADILMPNGPEVLEKCLSSSQMRGAKFHFVSAKYSFTQPAHRDGFIALMEVVQKHKGFVLIHLNTLTEDFQKEIEGFFEVTKRFSDVNFIVAHSSYPKPEGLRWIGEQYRANPLLKKNVYAETSNVFMNLSERLKNNSAELQALYREVWHTFGIDRVLFGSDFPISTPQWELENFMNSKLTPEEKYQILYLNGIKFLETLHSGK